MLFGHFGPGPDSHSLVFLATLVLFDSLDYSAHKVGTGFLSLSYKVAVYGVNKVLAFFYRPVRSNLPHILYPKVHGDRDDLEVALYFFFAHLTHLVPPVGSYRTPGSTSPAHADMAR